MTLWAALLLATVGAVDTPAVSISFLDVGQGDATLIESPEGKLVLVDGGRDRSQLANMLRELDVETLDLVVATHADADHTGGLEAVFDEVHVRAFLDNGRTHNTATYEYLMEAVEASETTYLQPTARTITLGSMTLRVLPPPPWAQEQNNASVGLLLEYGSFRALLVGDAEQDELNHFLRLKVPRVGVLKASHHGARNGVTPGWVYATRPRVVVVSVGADNTYGHPDPTAMRYYGRYAEAIYRTDRDGEILIEGRRDGSFDVTTWDEEGNNPVTRTFPPREAR